MKRLLPGFIALLAAVSMFASCECATKTSYPEVAAHRGCHLEGLIPENSIDGVEMAARFGYPAIEIDVKYTLDSVMVVMHDGTINRTMRTRDGYAPIEEKVWVKNSTFEELREGYVLASEDPARRRPIPTLQEILDKCLECGIHPILHSEVPESYKLAKSMFGDGWTAFSDKFDCMQYARSISLCRILWDPGKRSAEQTAEMLRSLGGPIGMSTMNYHMLRKDYYDAMHAEGMICQSSIFPSPREADAIIEGADIILSDFCWLQGDAFKPVAALSKRKTTMAPGTTLSHECPVSPEFGAVTVELDIDGEATLTVNGKWKYEIPRECGDGHVVLGFRSLRLTPSVELFSEQGCTLRNLKVKYYLL